MATIINIQTWTCPDCGYVQDFDPSDVQLMRLHHPEVPAPHCPACFLGQNDLRQKKGVQLVIEENPERQIKVEIMDEDDLDNYSRSYKDAQGNEKTVTLTEAEKNVKRIDIAEALNRFTPTEE